MFLCLFFVSVCVCVCVPTPTTKIGPLDFLNSAVSNPPKFHRFIISKKKWAVSEILGVISRTILYRYFQK